MALKGKFPRKFLSKLVKVDKVILKKHGKRECWYYFAFAEAPIEHFCTQAELDLAFERFLKEIKDQKLEKIYKPSDLLAHPLGYAMRQISGLEKVPYRAVVEIALACGISKKDKVAEMTWFFPLLFIGKKYMRCGIGSSVSEFILADLKKHGIKWAYSYTEGFECAEMLKEKFGFEYDKKEKLFYRKI